MNRISVAKAVKGHKDPTLDPRYRWRTTHFGYLMAPGEDGKKIRKLVQYTVYHRSFPLGGLDMRELCRTRVVPKPKHKYSPTIRVKKIKEVSIGENFPWSPTWLKRTRNQSHLPF